jgi:hypothetical protein
MMILSAVKTYAENSKWMDAADAALAKLEAANLAVIAAQAAVEAAEAEVEIIFS